MLKKFLKMFKDDRKYFAIVFFILGLILLSGILTPILIDSTQENWDEELSAKIIEIENSVVKLYKEKEEIVLSASVDLRNELVEKLQPGENSYGELIQIVNNEKYNKFSIEIFAPNGRLIGWNQSIAIPEEELFPLNYPAGNTYFYSTELRTYLTLLDTLFIENDLFYFAVSLPIEKHYDLQNEYFIDKSFSSEISDRFLTEFEVEYVSYTQKTKDGRKYSFEILNNHHNKIGLVTFLKPSVSTAINKIQNQASTIQSILVSLACLLVGFGFRKDFRSIKFRSLKFLVFAFYLGVIRALLYSVDFPSNLINGDLADPSYFSSAFGFGIVRSPLEFFISIIFVLILSVVFYQYLVGYIREKENAEKRLNILFYLTVAAAAFIFFMLLRGLIAALKSVIFDSTLSYFGGSAILPNLPAMMMNLNVLLIGLAVVIILSAVLFFLFWWMDKSSKHFRKSLLILFLFFQAFGILFVVVQKEPLISPLLSVFFTAIIFFLSYQIYKGKKESIYNYIYFSLASSLITITLMNYFNLNLEREALKTTALEINRPNDNLLRFLLRETLAGASKKEKTKFSFRKKNTNFDAVAFRLWSNSPLQRESITSSLSLLGKDMNELGKFNAGIDDIISMEKLPPSSSNEPTIIEINRGAKSTKAFWGIIPVMERQALLGFISSIIEYDLNAIGSGKIPEFLSSKKSIINSAIDARQLKIFEFENDRLENVYGDIYPSREQTEPILNSNFNQENEAWINLQLNNENYIIYALKSFDNGMEKITSVALREKQFTWNLFNFFKIFIIHSVFILAFTFFLFAISIKMFKLSFRAQLLGAFLIISIIPVLILAAYNRQVVNEQSSSAIFNELNERAEYIQNHVTVQKQKHSDRLYAAAFENAGKELGISFGVYDYTNQIFNSKQQYYSSGFFDARLSSIAHYQLNYLSYREFLTNEKIEDFEYNSFYRKIEIDNESFILGVNDAFNKVRLSFSPIDVDVFLFGVYSFAVIIIIIISTLLANKISDPVRRLTKATGAVAQGDLSIQLQNNEIGEMRDLLSGFNSMTKELQKNQVELAALERETAWKEMAKQVAHEIKNPLTPMKLAVQQMVIAFKDKANNFENIFEKISATLLNQIENLNAIASEFSRFAKMPSLNLEEVEMAPVINDTINLFTDEKVILDFQNEAEQTVVEADKSQLRRMIINLIRNAIQAGASEIKISLKKVDNNFEIIISDNGSGISSENREKIFDANFTTKEKGMGIGLKLTKRFLEGINGQIQLLSSSAEGTTFKITIPIFSQQKV